MDQRAAGVIEGVYSPAEEAKTAGRGSNVVSDRRTQRLLIASLAASIAAIGYWMLRAPVRLIGPIQIVGYPTFADFNFVRDFAAYRAIVFVFPATLLATYSILARVGPLSTSISDDYRRPQLVAHGVERSCERLSGTSHVTAIARRLLRLSLPMIVIAVSASARTISDQAHVSLEGLSWACAYALVTVAVATVGAKLFSKSFTVVHALTNATAGGLASLLALWLVSEHSVVLVGEERRPIWWAWVAPWEILAGSLAILCWTVLATRTGRSPVDFELSSLRWIVGSVLAFLLVSSLPGQLGFFEGFDDAQSLVGADFLRRGLRPWGDFMFIHGLYFDALRSNLGFELFENSRWGAEAGVSVVLVPLSGVFLYWFAGWASRWNPLVLLWCLALLPQFAGILDGRFILAPVVLLLLGRVISKGHWWESAGLGGLLFMSAVLVPEMVFLGVPCVLTLATAGVFHRPKSPGWWRAISPSAMWCVGAGLLLSGLWLVGLAKFSLLAPFLDYFRIAGPGHAASGALPLNSAPLSAVLQFVISVLLVFLSFGYAVYLGQRHHAWTPRSWVMMAAALFCAIYGQKAIGRFDSAHTAQVLGCAIPLLILWVALFAEAAQRWLISTFSHFGRGARRDVSVGVLRATRDVGYALAITACLLPMTRLPIELWTLPAREHAIADSMPTVARLGFNHGDDNQVLIEDLDKVFRKYAGRHGPVFDMTNAPGYFYYLLGRTPGTRFVHVSLAVPESAQKMLIKELAVSRPALVVFDGARLGLPAWDGISNSVRHYLVSRYVLRHWRPLVRVGGELLLLRRDLHADATRLRSMRSLVQTANLYSMTSGPCDWGFSPNFLTSEPAAHTRTLPLTHVTRRRTIDVRGWAIDPKNDKPAKRIVIADGRHVVDRLPTNQPRRDIAESMGAEYILSGFEGSRRIVDSKRPVSLFVQTADGRLHLLGQERGALPPRNSVMMPDGSRLDVAGPAAGALELLTDGPDAFTGYVRIPGTVALSHYDLVRVRSSRAIGRGEVILSPAPHSPETLQIRAQTRPGSARAVDIRASSCIQWYGYEGARLYVTQIGAKSINRLELVRVIH